MADSYIAIDEPAVTDKKLDTEQLTVGANTVERERMRIAGAAATDLAPVDATAGLKVNLGADNDVTVSGVATETKQDAGNALLTTLDADTSALAGTVSGAELQVDVVSSALPSGAATETTLATLKAALSVTAIQATASGDTQLLASGTRKLKRVEASNSHASTALTVGLKIASKNSGATFGKKYLPAAGGQAVWVFPDGYIQVTAEAVNVNLSAAGQIEVTAYYE
jgi:hypothetical protein